MLQLFTGLGESLSKGCYLNDIRALGVIWAVFCYVS